MQTRKEKVKTKMIQIPVSLAVYDQVRKKAEAEKSKKEKDTRKLP